MRLCVQALQTPSTTTQQKLEYRNPRLAELLARATLDNDLYESEDEPRPSAEVLARALNVLSALPRGFVRHIEVYPYFGEINILWRNPRKNGRVKATFGPAIDSCCVYWEQMANGRVSSHDLVKNANGNDVQMWVKWLYSAL